MLFDRVETDTTNDETIGISVRGTSGPWKRFEGTATSRSDFVPLTFGCDALAGNLPWHRLSYIRADRLGPTIFHLKSHAAVVQQRTVGTRGQFAVHILMEHGQMDVRSQMRLPDVPSTLEQQCGAWLDRLSVATRIYPADLEGTGAAVLRFSDGPVTGLSSGRHHRATNVGFGLSYALPVIVACLSSGPGDLLLIENPEAHLHPRGQSVVAELCARAAASGAQVILETHSDHVLNSVRLAVASKTLPAREAALTFFSRTPESGALAVEPLRIDATGQVESWPEGFFDEYMNALLELTDYGREQDGTPWRTPSLSTNTPSRAAALNRAVRSSPVCSTSAARGGYTNQRHSSSS
ncbi:MAG: AAA family ATPase [Acidimicrobiia bacterium]